MCSNTKGKNDKNNIDIKKNKNPKNYLRILNLY